MRLFLLIALALIVTGCSILHSTETNRQRMAVEYAVLKVTQGEQASKDRVGEIVNDVRHTIDQSQKVTVSDLFAEVNDIIRWDRLDAGQRFLIREILVSAEQRIKDEVGREPIIGPKRLKVETLLDWIEQAAT